MRPIYRDSYWRAGQPATSYPALGGDMHADVVIIGAGITGLTAALALKNAGKHVVVLEAGRIGDGTTGGTTAHLDAMPDQGMVELIKDFGEESARLVTQGRLAAIDQIESWSRQFGIDCDFRRIPAYYYTESPDGVSDVQEEHDACARAGLEVAMTTAVPLPFPVAGGFRLERHGRFHAQKYLLGLAAQVDGGTVALFEQTRAEPPEGGEPCKVVTNHGTVTARDVVAATHSAFFGISQLDMRAAPYQSYVIAARVDDAVPDALYWDDAEPYNYHRLAASSDPNLLLLGGADHKTGQGGELESFEKLEEYARRHFKIRSIEHRWSAEFYEPDDGLPFIGQMALSRHLYAATGYSGTGMTFGTMAGTIIADLILGRANPLADVFSPTRIKPVASAPDFIKENVNVAKRFVADRFKGKEIEGAEKLRPGDGLLAKIDGEQVALYRDEKLLLHAMSPVCTHAGCIVHWNAAEKTWDCPCHGGRYSATGERIYGPPPHDLGRATLD